MFAYMAGARRVVVIRSATATHFFASSFASYTDLAGAGSSNTGTDLLFSDYKIRLIGARLIRVLVGYAIPPLGTTAIRMSDDTSTATGTTPGSASFQLTRNRTAVAIGTPDPSPRYLVLVVSSHAESGCGSTCFGYMNYTTLGDRMIEIDAPAADRDWVSAMYCMNRFFVLSSNGYPTPIATSIRGSDGWSLIDISHVYGMDPLLTNLYCANTTDGDILFASHSDYTSDLSMYSWDGVYFRPLNGTGLYEIPRYGLTYATPLDAIYVVTHVDTDTYEVWKGAPVRCPTNCVYSDWSDWSMCSDPCDAESDVSYRTRHILAQNYGGGIQCNESDLYESVPCSIEIECVPCIVSEWVNATECVQFCEGGQWTQTRYVIQEPSERAAPCPTLEQNISCDLPECDNCPYGDWEYLHSNMTDPAPTTSIQSFAGLHAYNDTLIFSSPDIHGGFIRYSSDAGETIASVTPAHRGEQVFRNNRYSPIFVFVDPTTNRSLLYGTSSVWGDPTTASTNITLPGGSLATQAVATTRPSTTTSCFLVYSTPSNVVRYSVSTANCVPTGSATIPITIAFTSISAGANNSAHGINSYSVVMVASHALTGCGSACFVVSLNVITTNHTVVDAPMANKDWTSTTYCMNKHIVVATDGWPTNIAVSDIGLTWSLVNISSVYGENIPWKYLYCANGTVWGDILFVSHSNYTDDRLMYSRDLVHFHRLEGTGLRAIVRFGLTVLESNKLIYIVTQTGEATFDLYKGMLTECPVNCVHSEWTEWTECTAECGGGLHNRSRTIITEGAGRGRRCEDEPLEQEEVCNDHCCAIDCEYSEWSEWTECPVPCGGGIIYRNRTITVEGECGGIECDHDSLEEEEACNTHCCAVDCEVSEFTLTEPCNETCGGYEEYNRTVLVEQECGGEPCPPLTQSLCCEQNCTVTEFSDFGPCNDTTESYRERTRNIICNASCGGTECPHLVESECCPDDCEVGEFGEWSACNDTCNGHMSRTRLILIDTFCGGTECPHLYEDQCCLNDCHVSAFSEWSACTHACGAFGTQNRTRNITCDTFCGGEPCPHLEEQQSCNNASECPAYCVPVEDVSHDPPGDVNGWSPCPIGCHQIHYKNVSVNQSGEPIFGECPPYVTLERECHHSSCGDDCEVSAWSAWSECPGCDIETTVRYRTRTVTVNQTYNGLPCPHLIETQNCVADRCDDTHETRSRTMIILVSSTVAAFAISVFIVRFIYKRAAIRQQLLQQQQEAEEEVEEEEDDEFIVERAPLWMRQ